MADLEQCLNAYCVMCRTGSEQAAVKSINQNYPDITAIAPTRTIPEKRQGQWSSRDLILLPGYLFIFAQGELPHDLRQKTNHLYKVLQYERGIRTLTGSDDDYAQWVYKHQGKIEQSTVLIEGGQIKVVSGPLLDFEGRITKLDKHKRRAWVAFDFDGHKQTVCVGAECLDASGGHS